MKAMIVSGMVFVALAGCSKPSEQTSKADVAPTPAAAPVVASVQPVAAPATKTDLDHFHEKLTKEDFSLQGESSSLDGVDTERWLLHRTSFEGKPFAPGVFQDTWIFVTAKDGKILDLRSDESHN